MRSSMRLAFALAALVVASPAMAAERMTCDNGVTQYVAKFDSEPVSKVRIDDPSQRESPGRRGRSPPLRPTLLEQALSGATLLL